MSRGVLQAHDVCKDYHLGGRELRVLRGVNLGLSQGEFVAMQGASGSGKSTLLQLLGGLDRPTSGTIRFKGESLRLKTAHQAAIFRGQNVGFVFQSYHLLPDLDALENVILPAQVRRTAASISISRGIDLLASVGLADRMDHRPSELSGGEQQRVAIARALMNEPEIILADEPTGNLDTNTEAEIIDLLRKLHKERNLTLLVATHDEIVAAAAQRVEHLVDGKLTD
ncbi:MAG: ABC transporter ATP-binding protein [Verrucomicrobiota bacterium]|jgi:ABC-type lipoprotein export system ATPase subunit|nr:ABC transporter ATP-binding protein [Verrucomicrobiota bacterium]